MSEDSKTRCHKRLWHRDQWSHYRYQLGWWPLVGVQRNIVNVSLLHVRWITRDNGYRLLVTAHAEQQQQQFVAKVCIIETFWSCSFRPTIDTAIIAYNDGTQTDWLFQIGSRRATFISDKRAKIAGRFLWPLWSIYSCLRHWPMRGGGMGPSRGGQLGSFILCLPPAPALI